MRRAEVCPMAAARIQLAYTAPVLLLGAFSSQERGSGFTSFSLLSNSRTGLRSANEFVQMHVLIAHGLPSNTPPQTKWYLLPFLASGFPCGGVRSRYLPRVCLQVCQHAGARSCIVGRCWEACGVVTDGCVNVVFRVHRGAGGIACEAGGCCGIDVVAEWTWQWVVW